MTSRLAANAVESALTGSIRSGFFLTWLIGLLLLVAECAPSQDQGAHGSGGVGWISPRNDKIRAELRRLLLAVPTRDLAAGWQLAADLGQSAVPLLWELHGEERNVGRRLAVLAAAVLAGGSNEDERLFAYLAQPRPMLEERCLSMLLLALGPQRTRVMPDFWSKSLGLTKTPEQVMAIAVRLAAARFPEVADGAPGLSDGDPGVAAAAAFAGLPIPASVSGTLWNLKNAPRHAELFWRGAFLGAHNALAQAPQQAAALRPRAREIAALTDASMGAARAAATVLRSGLHDHQPDGPRLEWQVLQLAVGHIEDARLLRVWLSPTPTPRCDEPQRLAVAYVLSRNSAEVVGDRAIWAADTKIARHVAVALAWQLLGEAGNEAVTVQMPELPEWYLVRWASGAEVHEPPTLADAQLDVAARLAAAGRLPRAAARRLLEETLWRWGSHPGLGAWEQERLLVRDLLLVGSHPGGSKYVPHVRPELRYRPPGLGPDDEFYDVAVALFDFCSRPRGPVPAEHQLR